MQICRYNFSRPSEGGILKAMLKRNQNLPFNSTSEYSMDYILKIDKLKVNSKINKMI